MVELQPYKLLVPGGEKSGAGPREVEFECSRGMRTVLCPRKTFRNISTKFRGG